VKNLLYYSNSPAVKEFYLNILLLPVKAGIWGYEMWPDIITSIALSEWKFL
jgi:hypothetical protein